MVNLHVTFFKQKQQSEKQQSEKQQSEKYLVQPPCWHMTPKVQHFIDMQQDLFFVVCGLISSKAEQEKERVGKPQILHIYTRYWIMCVFFKRFYL